MSTGRCSNEATTLGDDGREFAEGDAGSSVSGMRARFNASGLSVIYCENGMEFGVIVERCATCRKEKSRQAG